MTYSIKIISRGFGANTKILNSDGKEIHGVTKIEFEPIEISSTVKAKLTFECVELEIEADSETNSKNEFLDAIINHMLNEVNIPNGKYNVIDALYKMKK